MAKVKTNKIVTTKKPVAKKSGTPKKNKVVGAPKKTVKTQKVKISDVKKEIKTEAAKTYKFGKYEVKKKYVWIAVAVVIALIVLF